MFKSVDDSKKSRKFQTFKKILEMKILENLEIVRNWENSRTCTEQ